MGLMGQEPVVKLALYACNDASISQRYELSAALKVAISLPSNSSSKAESELESNPPSVMDIFTLDLFEAAPGMETLVSAFIAT